MSGEQRPPTQYEIEQEVRDKLVAMMTPVEGVEVVNVRTINKGHPVIPVFLFDVGMFMVTIEKVSSAVVEGQLIVDGLKKRVEG